MIEELLTIALVLAAITLGYQLLKYKQAVVHFRKVASSRISSNSSEVTARKTVGHLSQEENDIRLIQSLTTNGIMTKGTVISSEEIYDPIDRESGFKIKVKFSSESGKVYFVEHSRTIHWPGNKQWETFVNQTKPGSIVTIFYRPDLDGITKNNLEFIEDYILEYEEIDRY